MWTDYGYVVSSKYRVVVILALDEHPKTPKQISRETKIGLSHVSRTLKELLTHSIVTCINPEAIKGRIYSLTEKGQEITRILKKDKQK